MVRGKAPQVPRAPTAIAVTELPGAESLLGEETAKSIFLSPNATPGRGLPPGQQPSKQELSAGQDWDVPAPLVIYLENGKLPSVGRGGEDGRLLEASNLNTDQDGKTTGDRRGASLSLCPSCGSQDPWMLLAFASAPLCDAPGRRPNRKYSCERAPAPRPSVPWEASAFIIAFSFQLNLMKLREVISDGSMSRNQRVAEQGASADLIPDLMLYTKEPPNGISRTPNRTGTRHSCVLSA